MRNLQSDHFAEKVEALFDQFEKEQGITPVDEFIKWLSNKGKMVVFDVSTNVHMPVEHGTVAYAHFHTVLNDSVITVYTYPGATNRWYCKY